MCIGLFGFFEVPKLSVTVKHTAITKQNTICRTISSKLGKIKEKLGLRMNFLLLPMIGFNLPLCTY